MNRSPKYKVYVKSENVIQQALMIFTCDEGLIIQYGGNGTLSFAIITSCDEIILLPYWRTVHGKDGDFDLHEGDIFQLEASSETYRYIVRYSEKEDCFMVAHTEQLQNEKNWKQNIWFRPDRTWWKDMYESRMSYLGNEHTNPELLEEK